MSQFYSPPPNPSYNPSNLQFYPSSYAPPGSGRSTPAQAQYHAYPSHASGNAGYGGFMASSPTFGGGAHGAAAPGAVSGKMGEQGGLRTGWLAAFGTEGYETEPPLLEELGVNFGHIRDKTLTVLNPLAHIDQNIMADSDLAGPILFFALFGAFLLLSGKLHFGYIYGLAAIGSLSLHLVFSLMSNPLLEEMEHYPSGPGNPHAMSPPPPDQNQNQGHMGSMQAGGGGGSGGGGLGNDLGATTLTFLKSASVLGYCLLPLVLTSLVGIVVPMDTMVGYSLTLAAVSWCTYSSSGMFCAVGRMKSMRPLVAYPLMLFYVGFGIMGIFSSRGSGALERRVG